MKKNHLKLMLVINFVLMLLYMGLIYYDDHYGLDMRYWVSMFIHIGMAGQVVNIIALLVMWFNGINAKRVMKAFVSIIGVCIICFVLSLLTGGFLFLLPLLAILALIYSLPFQIVVFCMEVKQFDYIVFALLIWFVEWMLISNIFT